MKLFLILPLLFAVVFMSGCKDDYYPCEKPNVSVTAVNYIIEGDALRLRAASNTEGVSYEWIGPNNFKSNEQNPTISNITLSAEGEYIVIAKKNGCLSSAAFDLKVVNKPPCTPVNNSIVLNGANYTVTNITVVPEGTEFITINAKISGASGSDVTVNRIPKNRSGVYLLDPYPSDFGEVGMIVRENGFSNDWRCSQGVIHVNMTSGKPQVTLCNVDFFQSFFGNSITRKLTSRITVP